MGKIASQPSDAGAAVHQDRAGRGGGQEGRQEQTDVQQAAAWVAAALRRFAGVARRGGS